MTTISIYDKIKARIENLDNNNEALFNNEAFNIAVAIARTNIGKLSEKGKKILYELLISKGFDIQSHDKEGNNLYYYASNGWEKDYLFEKGLSITHKNKKNIMMATYLSHYNLKRCLQKNVVIPENDFCDKGMHPFFERKGRVFIKIHDYIKNKNMINQKGENIAFYTTAQKKVIEELINCGVDFSLLNHKNENILFKASVSKIKIMMELNIILDVCHKNTEEKDPFDIAIKRIEELKNKRNSSDKELVLAYRRLNMLMHYAEYTSSYFPADKIIDVYQKAELNNDILMYKSEFEEVFIGKQLAAFKELLSSTEENPKPLKRL